MPQGWNLFSGVVVALPDSGSGGPHRRRVEDRARHHRAPASDPARGAARRNRRRAGRIARIRNDAEDGRQHGGAGHRGLVRGRHPDGGAQARAPGGRACRSREDRSRTHDSIALRGSELAVQPGVRGPDGHARDGEGDLRRHDRRRGTWRRGTHPARSVARAALVHDRAAHRSRPHARRGHAGDGGVCPASTATTIFDSRRTSRFERRWPSTTRARTKKPRRRTGSRTSSWRRSPTSCARRSTRSSATPGCCNRAC